jgi:hypothetical protein
MFGKRKIFVHILHAYLLASMLSGAVHVILSSTADHSDVSTQVLTNLPIVIRITEDD